VALKMALPMAAATPVMPISPMPRAPRGLLMRSGMSRAVASISGTSALTGTWYSPRLSLAVRP